MADALLTGDDSLFDYGCGRGGDLRRLTELGIECAGWDPLHAPTAEPRPADVVNLGYVINVIETLGERAETLRNAWGLARKVLVVSARLRGELAGTKPLGDYGDGVVTQRGTFQKFFEQGELREWIQATLAVDPVAAAPGIFYVFRDDATRANFLAARYRRAPAQPRLSRLDQLVSQNRDLFDSLSIFIAGRGRPPGPEEWLDHEAFLSAVGTMERGVRALFAASEFGAWETVKLSRTEDLTLYLALARFGGRPALHQLGQPMQRDIKAFFGSYKQACIAADAALQQMGETATRDSCLASATIGKRLPNALYLHMSAISASPLTIRLYEGCARHYAGSVEGANIVKFGRNEARISYLSYPDFDSNPHPPLASSVSVGLQTFQIRERDYSSSPNRPILHRKEAFLDHDHPNRAKFAKLTKSEEALGLYDEPSQIGLQNGWNEMLAAKGVRLKGHRIVKI
jgi:DNA phosphorothioation-associated putative methyltransferase